MSSARAGCGADDPRRHGHPPGSKGRGDPRRPTGAHGLRADPRPAPPADRATPPRRPTPGQRCGAPAPPQDRRDYPMTAPTPEAIGQAVEVPEPDTGHCAAALSAQQETRVHVRAQFSSPVFARVLRAFGLMSGSLVGQASAAARWADRSRRADGRRIMNLNPSRRTTRPSYDRLARAFTSRATSIGSCVKRGENSPEPSARPLRRADGRLRWPGERRASRDDPRRARRDGGGAVKSLRNSGFLTYLPFGERQR